MKQKTIKTAKATLLVVELPEGAYYPNICQLPPNIGVNYFLYENGVNTPYKEPLDIPKGNWQLLGRLPDITEEQAEKLVERHYMDGCRSYDIFRDYLLSSEDGRWTDNSLYSLSSLLQSNEVYFENPVKIYHDPDKKSGSIMDWHKTQSKVWDKERTYLLTKVD